MKNLAKKLLLFSLAILALPVLIFGQVVDTSGLANNPVFLDPSLAKMVNTYQVIFGALVIVWGYVAKAFGLKQRFKNNFVFVVVAGAVVIAGVFIQAGWVSGFSLIFPFLGAIGFYDIIFKPGERLLGSVLKNEPE